jgi:hypothetical protein
MLSNLSDLLFDVRKNILDPGNSLTSLASEEPYVRVPLFHLNVTTPTQKARPRSHSTFYWTVVPDY